MEEDQIKKLLDLARDQAGKHTDEALRKASDILLHAIDQGCNDPQILLVAGSFILQGPPDNNSRTREKAITLIDKAVKEAPEDISILEKAVHCYELILNDQPEKLNDLLNICLKILNLNPEHIESMITLANHRNHPAVTLSLDEAIRMLQWAVEVEPNNKMAAATLARLYLEAGQYNKARGLFKKVMAVTHSDFKSDPAGRDLKQVFPKTKNKRHRKYGIN
jgi:tetratricopeptide (TPR) repeat protein